MNDHDWIKHQTEAAVRSNLLPIPTPVPTVAPLPPVAVPRVRVRPAPYGSSVWAVRRLRWRTRWLRFCDWFWHNLLGRCPSCYAPLIDAWLPPHDEHGMACPRYVAEPLRHRFFLDPPVRPPAEEPHADRRDSLRIPPPRP